jgi:hypothetical protein
VRVRFIGEPSARFDIGTSSGDIRTSGISLTDERRTSRSVTGTLGTGDVRVEIRTLSGGISVGR